MEQEKLWEKIERIGQTYDGLDTALLQRFGQAIEGLSGWELFRINPLQFADTHAFAAQDVLPLFLYGAKVGLFEFDWNMVCPSCGGIEHSYESLNQIDKDVFHCTLCNVDIKTELDTIVEVSFHLHSDLVDVQLDPFADHLSYTRYFFSQNFVRSASISEFIQTKAFRSFTVFEGNETRVFELEGTPGETYRLVSLDRHMVVNFSFEDAESACEAVVEVVPSEPAQTVVLPAGKVTITVRNPWESKTGVMLLYTDFPLIHRLLEQDPPTFKPFLSGKMLLNNQRFRESFLVENVPSDLHFRIGDLTVLFTDLKGSTELYERTGDVFAFKLVQDHFKLLTEVVSKHAGATVKTMGDALMASFSTPADGVAAALEMIERMQELGSGEEWIGLKVGLHAGPALAVKANETIDFFGQTINIAARVQAKAAAGEVWVTEAVREDASVQALLCQRATACEEERHLVTLKGVQKPSVVYRWLPLQNVSL